MQTSDDSDSDGGKSDKITDRGSQFGGSS
jgi:hypothetical protein